MCDSSCGSGQFGDLHCNWRSLGLSCRYCFHDIVSARLADEIASTRGGRVIMCGTHLPPRAAEDVDRSIQAALEAAGHAQPPPVSSDSRISRRTVSAEERRKHDDPSNLEFVTNTSRGQLCAFIPGYLEFLPETNITVSSINLFMPGIKMAVATKPIDFHVYNRYGNVNIDQYQCHRQCIKILAISNPQEV